MKKITDMTEGSPLGLLVRFALPLLLGSLCQLLYTTADSAVVGRLIGVGAFAAVGAAGFLSWLVVDMILGLTQGFGVLFAQIFGKKQWDRLRQAIAVSSLLAFGIGAALTVLGLLSIGFALDATGVPLDIRSDAVSYLQVIFSGTLITMFHRLAGTLLQSLGNSRVPVIGNVASCILNIALDLLFVGGFGWGVIGAALATVAAQLGSFLYCLSKLWDIPQVRLSRNDFILPGAMPPALVRELLRLGGPLAFRNGVISVGGLFVQSAINGCGKLFVAGMAAAEKYFGLVTLTGCALDGAFAYFSAQNYGAGRMDRIKAGLRASIWLSLASSAVMAVLLLVFGKQLLGLLITGKPEELQQILQAGYEYLTVLAFTVPLMLLLCLYRSGLQGMGSAFAPTLSGFIELGLRIVSVLFLPNLLGRFAIYLANPLGWLGASILLACSYYRVYHRLTLAQAEHK